MTRVAFELFGAQHFEVISFAPAVIASQRVGRNSPPDDRLREAIQPQRSKTEPMDCFVASLLAMTVVAIILLNSPPTVTDQADVLSLRDLQWT
jgi:hypothetical protein